MALPVTLSDQVTDMKKREISYRNLHTTAVLYDENTGRNIEIPWDSISRKYKDALDKIRIQIKLTDTMVEKYQFNPKLVSFELYRTTEFWNDILLLNNCGSVLDFTEIKYLTAYNPEELKSLINEIMIHENIL